MFSVYSKLEISALPRGGSRTTTTSKMELFVIIVNGFQPLTTITKCSILDVAAVLDPPLLPDTLHKILNKKKAVLIFEKSSYLRRRCSKNLKNFPKRFL